jgi:transposase IS116/IS110/IS902 family protein
VLTDTSFPGRGRVKSAEEIMNILEAYDLTGSFRDAGELAGCSHHTVARYVRAREEGCPVPGAAEPRPMLIDEYLPKLEELVDRSRGKIRADKAHRKITAMGYAGSERTTRRAVARLKQAWHAGRRRVHRPWIVEPGMWAQYDFGGGPEAGGAATVLFCLWLAWCRFRVVIPILDRTSASVWAACDTAFRRLGGVPTYLLTDNEKTVTVEHVAGIPVRNPGAVEFGRHYGVTVATCVPYDPASKGGSESTVKLAKADLVPAETNLRAGYGSFAELEAACAVFCEQVNARPHRVTRRAPAEMLAEERARLHPVPAVPFTAALGVTRRVDALSLVMFEGGQYSVGVDMSRFPTPGHLASWAGRTPLEHQSGARAGKASRKHGNRYIGAVTGETAVSAGRTDTREGARHRRLARKRGRGKACVATGNTQMRVFHVLLSNPGMRYADLGADWYDDARQAARRVSGLVGALDAMGYEVTLCRKPGPGPEAAPAA